MPKITPKQPKYGQNSHFLFTFCPNFAYMGTSRGFSRENWDNFYKYGVNGANLDVFR